MGGFEQGMLILAAIVLFNALLAALFPLPIPTRTDLTNGGGGGGSSTVSSTGVPRTVHKLQHPSGPALGAVVRGQP